MSFLGIVKTHWLGTTGGPGLTQFAVRKATDGYLTNGDAQAAVNAVRAFWSGVALYIPNEVTLTVDPVVDTFYVGGLNNDLETSASAATAPTVVTGGGTGAYSMAAGLRVNLNTGIIRYGRRVNGSFFMVPADTAAFTVTGTTSTTAKTAIENSGATMLSSFTSNGLVMGVWSRWDKVKHPDRASAISDVLTVKVNDKTAVLRGRRD
jgi:hypothetical protein